MRPVDEAQRAVDKAERARGFAARVAAWPLLKHPRVRKALLWTAIVLAAILVLWLLAYAWSLMSSSIRQLLILLLAVSAVLLWFVKGAPRLRRRQALRRAKGDLAPGDPENEQEPRRNMLGALRQTKQVLARSPEVDRKRDPLYAIPWILFLGDAQAAADDLLQVARSTAPFPPPPPSEASQYWRWWLFKGMIAIQADPRLVCDQSDRVTRGIWYHALQQLNAERASMPLNGIAVLVAADKLIGDPDAVRPLALNLRRLVDECMEHLQIVVPVYVIVTGCERLPGYEDFVRHLPVDALRQAVGHRLEAAKHINPSTWQEFNAIFAGLCDRMHAIRLAAIRREAEPARRKGIWDFAQGFVDLGPGLSVVIKALLEENPFQRTPQWRGLYFTASAGKGGFVDDLVTRFLPADQPLARRTRHPGLKRWLGSAVSVILVGAVTALIVYQVSTAMADNRRLREAVASACEQLATGRKLAALTDCAEDLATVEQLDGRAGLTWGISQYRDELAAKQTLLLSEIRKIINAYDTRIEYDISSRFLGLDHIVATAQRLALLERCQPGPERCRRESDEPNLMFDPTSRLYATVEPFTSKEQDKSSQADGLLELYLAYLRWGAGADPRALEVESARAADYLKATVAAHPVAVEDIVAWSKTRNEPVTAQAMWEMPDAISSHGRRVALPVVDAALTYRAWQFVVQPTLAQMALVADDPGVILALKEAYFERYFAAWRDFLAGFEQGVHGITKATAPGLLTRAAQGDSPYVRLWRAVGENLFALPLAIDTSTRWALTWQAIKQNWVGVFGYLWRFLAESVGLEKKNPITPPAWLLALKYTLQGDWKAVDGDLAAFWPMLQADEGSAEKAGAKTLDLAREIFSSKGEKPDRFAALKAASSTPPARFKLPGEEVRAWESVAGEVQMLLTLIGYRAAARVDADWRDLVLPGIERDGGGNPQRVSQAIQSFAQGTLGGFVNEADRTLKPVLGVTLPLSRRFQALLREQRDTGQPEGKPIRIGTIELIQPSTFGMVREGPTGTTLQIRCGTDDFAVSSKGQSKAERQVSISAVPEQCLTALIRIALPEYQLDTGPGAGGADPGQAPRVLIKSYAEPVFAGLAEDFKTGAKNFTLADFKTAYSQEEWMTLSQRLNMMGINQVRVFAAVTLSPEMEQRSGTAAATGSLPGSIVE